ncbi:MAG: hypothetical protein WAJ93_17335 [Candidatus Nitrosopolaris sp.]
MQNSCLPQSNDWFEKMSQAPLTGKITWRLMDENGTDSFRI